MSDKYFFLLGIKLEIKEFPELYDRYQINPGSIEAQVKSIAVAFHEGNLQSAAVAFEMDLERE